MKNIVYLSHTEKKIQGEFSPKARLRISNLLNMLCVGLTLAPQEFKYMPTVGTGVYELRVKVEKQYRVFYVTKFNEAVYVLHAFSKKTQQTAKNDIQIGVKRYKELLNFRSKKT